MNPEKIPSLTELEDMQTLRDSGIPTDRHGNVLEDDQVNPEDALPADIDVDKITG